MSRHQSNSDLAVVGGWVGGNQVENNATSWSNLQDCKISSRVEIPKLDPSVAIIENIMQVMYFKNAMHIQGDKKEGGGYKL